MIHIQWSNDTILSKCDTTHLKYDLIPLYYDIIPQDTDSVHYLLPFKERRNNKIVTKSVNVILFKWTDILVSYFLENHDLIHTTRLDIAKYHIRKVYDNYHLLRGEEYIIQK